VAFDGFDGAADVLDVARLRAARGDDDAEPLRAVGGGGLRALDDGLLGQQFIFFDRSFGNLRLRAVTAIFRANAALRVQQNAYFDAIAEVRFAHAARG